MEPFNSWLKIIWVIRTVSRTFHISMFWPKSKRNRTIQTRSTIIDKHKKYQKHFRISFQEDMVCLSCTATGERVCLAAEGFGNRHCFLENIADKNVPPDLSQCVFVIEQALSVRALQELVTAAGSESVSYHQLPK